jgi:hypothetical protein
MNAVVMTPVINTLSSEASRETLPEPLLRTLIGAALRSERLGQSRTLRNVSQAARVSLGYLSEIERGQKEASSELLAAICTALEVRLIDVLHDVLTSVGSMAGSFVAAGSGSDLQGGGSVEPLPVRTGPVGTHASHLVAPAVNRAA